MKIVFTWNNEFANPESACWVKLGQSPNGMKRMWKKRKKQNDTVAEITKNDFLYTKGIKDCMRVNIYNHR